MKPGLFAAAVVILAGLCSWSGPSAQARPAAGSRGGGGSHSFGGGGRVSGGGHFGGMRPASGGYHGRSFLPGRSVGDRPSSRYVGGGDGGNATLRRGGANWADRKAVTPRVGGTHAGAWARRDPRNNTRFGSQTQRHLRDWQGRPSSFSEAQRHCHGNRHGHHGRTWWRNRCAAIIIVGGGFWGWYDGWWYPAWGYDSDYANYEYDEPVYGYNGLPPDEAIANVQIELQRLGYYRGSIDGILGRMTQDALRRYQRDRGLPVTGAIDPETIRALRQA